VFSNAGFRGIGAVDTRVVKAYISCMRPLGRVGYSVGQVRKATLEEIMSKENRVSRAAAYFAKTAFARPEPRF